MTASRDPDRLIRAFLDEGLTELPDRVYDVVRSDIDRTRQRVVVGPWRTPDMNSLRQARDRGRRRRGGRLHRCQPATQKRWDRGRHAHRITFALAITNTESGPSSTPAAVFPPIGKLAMGARHSMTRDGVRFSLSVPTSDWISNGDFAIDKSGGVTSDGAGFIFWGDAPIGVFADPCAQKRSPPVGASVADLAAAVATVPGTDLVSGPSDVTVGGHPAKHLVLTVREDVGCTAEDFYLWYAATPGLARYATELGSTIGVWIVDVDGKIVWIDGETFKGAGAEPGREIQQIVDSIAFE